MSNYILYKGLKRIGADVDYVIPHRVKEGYGISEDIIEKAAEDGINTIVTCDNGIAANAALTKAKELGMMVLVTDHHQVPFIMEGEEKQYVLEHYENTPMDIIKSHLQGRSECAIVGIAHQYGLKSYYYMSNIWSEDEDNLLRELYPISKTKDIAQKLNRSVQAVIQRANNLGIYKDKSGAVRYAQKNMNAEVKISADKKGENIRYDCKFIQFIVSHFCDFVNRFLKNK